MKGVLGFVATVLLVAAPWPVHAGVCLDSGSSLHRPNQGHGDGEQVAAPWLVLVRVCPDGGFRLHWPKHGHGDGEKAMADLVYSLGVAAGEQTQA